MVMRTEQMAEVTMEVESKLGPDHHSPCWICGIVRYEQKEIHIAISQIR